MTAGAGCVVHRDHADPLGHPARVATCGPAPVSDAVGTSRGVTVVHCGDNPGGVVDRGHMG